MHRNALSPAPPPPPEDRRQLIINWWTDLMESGDAGETTWEVLERIQDGVTECLMQSPPDYAKAESLTAKAALLVGGLHEN